MVTIDAHEGVQLNTSISLLTMLGVGYQSDQVTWLLLLTTQRRAKAVALRWQDVASDGKWTILAKPREKGTAAELVLPQLAFDIIGAQPRLGDNPYVLAGRATATSTASAKRTAHSTKSSRPNCQTCRKGS